MERGSHLCVLTPIGNKRKFEDPVEDLGDNPGEDDSCDNSSYGDSSYKVTGEELHHSTDQTQPVQFQLWRPFDV